LPLTEILQSAFSMVWGNAPGIVVIVGCGDAPKEEIGWLAYELTRRNCMVFTAGCGAAELARHYIDSKGKYLMETYLASIEPRSLVNCGGCAAISLANNMYMYSRAAGGIPLYGGIPEVGEGSFYTTFSLLLWGAVPDRMYAVAAAYARLGIRVVVGPTSAWAMGRFLPGDRYDRSKWWVYHGDDGRKRETEPIPEHLLVPVETKEEALTMIPRMFFSTSEMREGRAARMDFFLELYRIFYNELPLDWQLLVRSHLDIPTRHRIKLLKVLRDEFGWEGDGLKITRARNRDGKLLTLSEFNTSYGMELGRYHTRLKRLLPNSVKQKLKDE
jgi:acetyl-CoA decarbonylase/synthase complex subunit alpha